MAAKKKRARRAEPAALAWTTKTPTRPGLYLVRHTDEVPWRSSVPVTASLADRTGSPPLVALLIYAIPEGRWNQNETATLWAFTINPTDGDWQRREPLEVFDGPYEMGELTRRAGIMVPRGRIWCGPIADVDERTLARFKRQHDAAVRRAKVKHYEAKIAELEAPSDE